VGENERNRPHFGEPSHLVAQNGLAELGCPTAERGTGIQSGLCDSLTRKHKSPDKSTATTEL